MPTYLDDIEFVFLEVARIARLGPKEVIKLPWPEIFATLPHPSGTGEMICGAVAYRRLQGLVERALSRSQHAGFVNSQAVLKELTSIIVQRFLRDKRELNTQQASRAVSAAIRAAARARTDRTHLVPCHLGHAKKPENFSIGPVSFRQRSKLFEQLEPAFRAYLDEEPKAHSEAAKRDDRRKLAEKLLSDARDYYESFDWVAQVAIGGCDPPTSRRRAERIFQSALDCLHLLIGADYSNHMRAGGPNFRTDRRGGIEMTSSGNVEVSASVDWLSHNLGDGWWEMINGNGGDQLIALMGVAIEAGHNVPRPAPLAQRFLDGVAWYGEAVRDGFGASRLVKYVTAIERIVTTKKERNLAEVLAKRSAALILDPDTDDLGMLRERFRNIYDLRSRLVHGSRSPLDPGLGAGIREAENLARSVLFRALQFFRREGLEIQPVTKRKLDEAYSKLLEWADTVVALEPASE